MKPLVNNKVKLEKFHGKGGWTFARIPNSIKKQANGFGWSSKVKGSIDDYRFEKVTLMPMRDGKIFLPVRSEIRKQIKKEAGDYVTVILYPDKSPVKIPEELLLCMKDEPEALKFFNTLSESERKFYINWVVSAKREETRVTRLAKTVNRLLKGLKLYDKRDSL